MPPNISTKTSPTLLTERWLQERARLGLGVQQTAELCGVTRHSIFCIERGTNPGANVLAGFAAAGADINFVLTGHHRVAPAALTGLFGRTLHMQEPSHLLGALLCVNSANADYTPDFNPYPPSSPHHAGVEIGWRMARAAITGETTSLPGTL